ncbi:hypothetical protein KAFR_0B05860 [Kazachstania africana CBS 2517]|uniref:SH3 domain-containing protein n=1 Tax=Kazachstania africana (strain ATCC 22294 / BCRC 22015 / CBS 2517 / CECT 1963 / NBRC 1671 / NRRL Y-8276) TaxID=1071382 RepID=H2AR82_KAZAF|nr:hypothetical protein KAFR_0B05860 [Kazachstania africana CBS 2517]CCF56882.1 hypothetical protein KAFR_0B05860 [Kazachstania africana CBS 2517]
MVQLTQKQKPETINKSVVQESGKTLNIKEVPAGTNTLEDIKENVADDLSDISYISIKDFAYDDAHPLHYGYFNDGEDDEDEEEDTYLEPNETSNDNIDRRQSIILPNEYVINQRAIALYDFEPENDNELGLHEGDIVFISYRHGQGWLVAENQPRTKTGLVPEEFVSFLDNDEEDKEAHDMARPFYLTHFISQGLQNSKDISQGNDSNDEIKSKNRNTNDNPNDDDEWEDIDELGTELGHKLNISVQEE